MNPFADRQLRLGVIFLVLLGSAVALAVLQYRGAFRSTIPVTVQADRAGLTMDAGAPVKFRGVEVGRVRAVTAREGRVEIDLAIDKDVVDQVPSGLTAQLVPPTAFGARYVQLTATGEGSGHIEAEQLIAADHVTVEVDEAFTNLTEVLDAAQPDQVNGALSAVAGAVDQRGRRINELIRRGDGYLASLRPSLDELADDVRRGKDVAAGYADATPDFVRTLRNATDLSGTVVAERRGLHATARELRAFSNETRGLLRDIEPGLHATLALLLPVTALLDRYSSELPCLVQGLAGANELAEGAVGGTNPGVTTITRLVPGAQPYRYPDHLPVVGDRRGPGCFGLPYVDPAEARQPSPRFVSGANPYAGGDTPTTSQDPATTLLGSLAGLVVER